MKLILTADGTETFLNEDLGESYHSQTGALEEAFKKFAEPAKIKERVKQSQLKILDICSGLFYNSAAALDLAGETKENQGIEIFALEKDWRIIEKVEEVNPPFVSYSFFKKFVKEIKKTKKKEEQTFNFFCPKKKARIYLLIGDARQRIRELKRDYFEIIFLDPFSPRTAPEMWEVSFFREMYRVLKEQGLLLTYSCARLVRENMKKAGFFYIDGPRVSRRGPGTLGSKTISGLTYLK